MSEERNEIREYIKEVEELEKNYKPKNTASPCYDFFLDYMKCMRHVSSIVQQSQNLFKLPESKEKIKFTNFCMDSLDRYEHCTHQYNTDLENLDFRFIKHGAQDMEQYHRSLSLEERATAAMGLSFKLADELDPNWRERVDMEIPED